MGKTSFARNFPVSTVAYVFENQSLVTCIADWLDLHDIESMSVVVPLVQDILQKKHSIDPWRRLFKPRHFETELLFQIPNLAIMGDRGHTGYIDFIQEERMTASVMRGLDVYHRPFMAFRIVQDGRHGVLTIFQRYTDISSFWVSCGADIHGYEGVVVLTSHHTLMNILQELLVQGECSYEYVNMENLPAVGTVFLVE